MAFGSNKLGCDSCEDNIRAELEDKDPEDRTEKEQAIVDKEQDPPLFNGPLWPNGVDGCSLCHGAGQLGALIVTLVVMGILYTQASMSDQGIIRVGVALFVVQALVVGVVGNYPLLGPLLGPPVEWFFAKRDIYLTAKAEKEYGGQEDQNHGNTTVTDGGVTAVDTEVEEIGEPDGAQKFDLPEDYLKSKDEQIDEVRQVAKQRKSRIETLQEVLETKDEKLSEFQTELKELKKSKNEKGEKVSQLQGELENKDGEIDRLKGLLEIEARGTGVRGPGGVDPGDTIKFDIPHPSKDVDVGDWYLVDVKWYDHPDFRKDQPVPVAVPSLKALGQLPNHIPEQPGDGFIEKHSDLFPVHPEDYSQPIDAMHSGVADPGDTVLFKGSFAHADDVQEQGKSQDVPFHSADLTLNVDLAGNVVRDEFEPANVRQLREKNQRLRRNMQKYEREVDNRQNKIDDLENSLKLANIRIDDLQDSLERNREDMRVAVEGVETMQKQAQIERKGRQQAEERAQARKEERDEAHKRARDESRKRYMDKGSLEEDKTFEKSTRSRRKKEIEAIDKIRPVWKNNQVDWDHLDNPDYEKDRGDVISEFLNDPEADAEVKFEIKDMFESTEEV